jgi:hypothetical protein
LAKNSGETAEVRLFRLGMLAEKLAALIEDLRSVDISATDLQPLETLLADLRALPMNSSNDAEVVRLWSHAEQTLRSFAEGAAGPQRSERFWK